MVYQAQPLGPVVIFVHEEVFVDEGYSQTLGHFYSIRKDFHSHWIVSIPKTMSADWIEEVKEPEKPREFYLNIHKYIVY